MQQIRQATRRRRAAAPLFASVIAAAAATVLPTIPIGVGSSPAAAGPVSVVLDGHGYGHGVGLSQYGALGYAINYGWSATQILDHYFGTTVSATAANTDITVRISGLDNAPQTAVVHDKGALVIDGVVGGPWRSLVARETADGHYSVWGRTDANVCPAASDDLAGQGWGLILGDSTAVTFRPATNTSANADVTDLVGLCEPSTGRVRYYRGSIRAVNSSTGANRTVSQLPIEQYIRSVVGGEVSWGWAAMGGGKGAQALQAQAVAARSYGLAENKESYAQTCDNNCQTYRGAGYRAGVGGVMVAQEFGPTDLAVTATSGVVRRMGTTAGPIAYTMYSSSSGGFTAATTLGFPAVIDEGDAVSGNAAHNWSSTVAASTIEAAYPAIGSFGAVTVVSRDGNGEWGGRVLDMRIEGSASTVSTTGSAFRSKLGLKSNWFTVRGSDGTPPAAPSPDAVAPCIGRTAASIAGVTANSAASLFSPIPPRRLIDTRIGWGTEQMPLGVGCTLEVDPQVPDDATAVVVNVTAIDPDLNGYLTAYPCGAERPLASIVPAIAGRIVPGTAIVPLDADGHFCVYSMRSTDIVIDLSGVYRTGGGVPFEPIVAERRYDSRGGPLLANQTVVRVQVAGVGSVPASATAIAATVHSTNALIDGFITIWPCDTARPTTSVLNTSPGASVTNHIQVGLDDSGAVCMYAQHAMHLVLDVSGWFGPTATASYHALMPTRLLDTREGVGLAGVFSAGQNRALSVVGTGGVPASGVSAVAAEVTSTDATSAGYITVHPCQTTVPQVSMVRNFANTVAATTVTGIVDTQGRWCLMASVAMHMVLDVSGYYD
ncbi:MAG: SpoIID/LytB domain-containing protein [Ilumatobacteraceae bacterium]